MTHNSESHSSTIGAIESLIQSVTTATSGQININLTINFINAPSSDPPKGHTLEPSGSDHEGYVQANSEAISVNLEATYRQSNHLPSSGSEAQRLHREASVQAQRRRSANLGNLVLIHGFWSSPDTWAKLAAQMSAHPGLAGIEINRFHYESPKLPRLPRPWSTVRIPNYNDIAQSLPAYLDATTDSPDSPIAIVTHSQGGLILQRFLAWMLSEGRGRELARVKLIVMLACPNEGSEFAASIRAATGYNRHPQARDLKTLSEAAGDARRIVLRQIVHASVVDDQRCPIPVRVYAGRTDAIVTRQSAQSAFPHAEVLPGDHFSILDPHQPGNLTAPTLTRLLQRHLNDPQGLIDFEEP